MLSYTHTKSIKMVDDFNIVMEFAFITILLDHETMSSPLNCFLTVPS